MGSEFRAVVVAAVAGLAWAGAGSAARAVVVQDFAGGGGFDGTFEGFNGAVTPGATGITIDSTAFGGGFTGLPSLQLASDGVLRVTAQALPGNVAATFNLVFIDADSPTTGEGWVYTFDTADFAGGGLVSVDFGAIGTPTGGPNGAFGLGAGDGVFNLDAAGGLIQYQIQSAFGSGDRLNLLVSSVEVVNPIPEPAAALVLAAVPALLRRTRRA